MCEEDTMESIDFRFIVAMLGVMRWGLVFHYKGQS